MSTGITWTNETWNPTTGCSKVSQGCKHCYAERMAKRLAGRLGYPADDPFKVTLHPDRLAKPLRWRKPKRIFVDSMSDLFHKDVPNEFIDQVFAVMMMAEQHTFQVLTKRPERMMQYLASTPDRINRIIAQAFPDITEVDDLAQAAKANGQWPLPNVWLGVSVENQQAADERIPLLLQTPAAVRWISAEPLLGPIQLSDPDDHDWLEGGCGCTFNRPCGELYQGLDWVVVGGESGPGARPMHPDWARSLRDQCKAAGVPFLFKQWGEWCGGTYSYDSESDIVIRLQNGQTLDLNEMFSADTVPEENAWLERRFHSFNERAAWCDPITCYGGDCAVRVGKKAAGRLLDGVLHDEYPEVRA